MSVQNNAKIKEYDVLRAIATLLVVIGHCAYYNITTKYGGFDYLSGIGANGKETPSTYFILQKITGMIYSFHMPLFIALSGTLFYIKYNNENLKLSPLVKSKSSRLIIPFIFVSLLYVIPIKWLTGYYKGFTGVKLIKAMIKGQVLLQGNNHLWYLVCLFFIFIIMYFLIKNQGNEVLKIALLILCNLISYRINILILNNVFKFAIYFYLGFKFEKYRESINLYLLKYRYIPILATAIFVGLCYYMQKCTFPIDYMNYAIKLLVAVIGSITVYFYSFYISIRYNFKLLNKISDQSYGIYLYSDPINYIILLGAYQYSNGTLFQTNAGTLFLYVFRFVVTGVGAYFISILVNRSNLLMILKKAKASYRKTIPGMH